MNNLGITSEGIIDLTDTEKFLDAKQEENDCIFIIDDEDDELIEVIPETEKNEIQTRGNFETIFLPEVYTGVAVETPFFDILKYKQKIDHSTDENGINTLIYNSNNGIRLDAYEHQYIDELQEMSNENGYNCQMPLNFIYKSSTNSTNQFDKVLTQSYRRREFDDVNPLDSSLVKNRWEENNNECESPSSSLEHFIWNSDKHKLGGEISNENGYNCQTPLNINYKSLMDSTNQYDKALAQSYMRRECEDVIPVDRSLVKDKLHQKRQILNECKNPSSSNPTKHFTWNSDKRKLFDEVGKYKCPICRIPKTFDTLLAVNNHLKFSHLSFFSNKKNELYEQLID